MSLMSVKMSSVGGGIHVVIYLRPFHRVSIFLCEPLDDTIGCPGLPGVWI